MKFLTHVLMTLIFFSILGFVEISAMQPQQSPVKHITYIENWAGSDVIVITGRNLNPLRGGHTKELNMQEQLHAYPLSALWMQPGVKLPINPPILISGPDIKWVVIVSSKNKPTYIDLKDLALGGSNKLIIDRHGNAIIEPIRPLKPKE